MKIAAVCSLFFDSNYLNNLNDSINTYTKCADILFESAKKHFLKNHELDLLLITNHPQIQSELDFVKTIRVDHHIHNNWHGYLMKVLCLEYVPKEYDYIFSLDVDQVFINEVVDEEVLTNDFIFMRHWYTPTYASILSEVTNFISVDFDAEKAYWAIGNFFGGKSESMYDLFEKSNKIHNELFNKKIMESCNFYSRYPEELFVGKYAYENNTDYKYLTGSMAFDQEPDKNFFLGDFEYLWRKYASNNNDESVFQNLTNVKLIHQTKINMEAFDKFLKYHK